MIETRLLPDTRLDSVRRAAMMSPAYDGPKEVPRGAIVLGARTLIKLQRRTHERLERMEALEIARSHGVPAPALLDKGVVDGLFFAVMTRVAGAAAQFANAPRQQALGRALRLWHDHVPPVGLALDDPGALGVFFGTLRGESEGAAVRLGQKLSAVVAGAKPVAIHSDVAVTHNTLYSHDVLRAVIDPGAIAVGPAMLDLAWALAVDEGDRTALLDGYGHDRVDVPLLEALLPLMFARRFADMRAMDRVGDAARLYKRAPELIKEIGL